MTSNELIRFGAYAQKYFNMKDNFKVQIYPEDSPQDVRVLVPSPIQEHGRPIGIAEWDVVRFEHIGDTHSQITIRAGYSRAANVLCIAGG